MHTEMLLSACAQNVLGSLENCANFVLDVEERLIHPVTWIETLTDGWCYHRWDHTDIDSGQLHFSHSHKELFAFTVN